MAIVKGEAYARAALVGHPSDNFPEFGYPGAVLAMTVPNFSCTVEVWESPSLTIHHNDRQFGNWRQLLGHTAKYGIFDEEPFLRGGLSVFARYCKQHGILRRLDRNISIRLARTNIPRQLGLSGSSAIVTATIQALMSFYRLTPNDIPLSVQGWLILEAEREAQMKGGLQDKMTQAFGAAGHHLLLMHFPVELRDKPEGQSGIYQPLDFKLLPRLAMIYTDQAAKRSYSVHSRWDVLFRNARPKFLSAVKELPALVEKAVKALRSGDFKAFGKILNRCFELRLATCGTSDADKQVHAFCEEHGVPSNQTGSGGAAILVYESPAQIRALHRDLPREWKLVEIRLR
jgi:glucuronokinase